MPLLTSRLKPGCIVTQLDPDATRQHLSPKDGYEGMGGDHLMAVKSGGAAGLECLSGALIIVGSKAARTLCQEAYGRDVIAGPHAESMTALPSNIPTRSSSTQYSGRLKLMSEEASVILLQR